MTVPDTVQGLPSVTCTYQPGREMLLKFWCKPSYLCRLHGQHLKLQPEARHGRFSILDSCVSRAFRVAMERLVKEDEDMFSCGMLKGFSPLQQSADVEVIITPGRSLNVFPTVTGTRCPSGTHCIPLIFPPHLQP